MNCFRHAKKLQSFIVIVTSSFFYRCFLHDNPLYLPTHPTYQGGILKKKGGHRAGLDVFGAILLIVIPKKGAKGPDRLVGGVGLGAGGGG